jgi:hypothetical protein
MTNTTTHDTRSKLALEAEGDKFTSEQKAYIVKYAAGLLLAWTEHAVRSIVSPDIGDGFEPPEGVFPPVPDDVAEDETPLQWEAHDEVCGVLGKWLEGIAELAGFSSVDEASQAVGNTETVYGKYPVMKS